MKELGDRPVSEVMSREVVTIEGNETLLVADRRMEEHRIRHLLVVDRDGSLVGVLTRRDLFRGALASALGYGTFAQEKVLSGMLAKEVMSTEPVTTSPNATLRDAAQVMIRRRIGCLPAMEGEKVVGIITEGDFVRLMLL